MAKDGRLQIYENNNCMDKLEAVYKLHKLLKGRRTVLSRKELERELELAHSTATRFLQYCRDRLQMPLIYDRSRGGYCYDEKLRNTYELPGLWFNADELNALMTSHQLLAKVQPGVLDPYIAPLRERLATLLEHRRAGSKEIFNRVRILPIASRETHLEDFQQCANALVRRRRLRVLYSSRSRAEVSERWISPQRLVYYRDNWYLDAWCHLREGLRTFALDRLRALESGDAAKDIDDATLDEHLTRTYGIFSGPVTARAVIHFSADAARWIADEEWHPDQTSRHLSDGRWELEIPYGNPTELIRDILKFGADAEVISPPELRVQVKTALEQALALYQTDQ